METPSLTTMLIWMNEKQTTNGPAVLPSMGDYIDVEMVSTDIPVNAVCQIDTC